MERKNIHRCVLMILVVLLSLQLHAQQNLVPNPSFEEHTGCPEVAGHVWLAPVWLKVGGDGLITYYHECGEPCCSIPVSRGGGGYARTGHAYVDLVMFHNNHLIEPLFLEGNFLGTSLSDTLEIERRYKVKFYVSLFDSCRFAGRNIGVYFSDGQPPDDDELLVALQPQVRYDGEFLTNKEGWVEISGDFIAIM